jgi:GTP-binding protein
MKPVIAIVGRPNVGKSTLFNRLSRSRGALVDDRPGVTRDRLYATIRYGDAQCTLVDTAGFDDRVGTALSEKMKAQVARAVGEADRIIFMVDGRQGPAPGDDDIADILRRSRKPVLLAVNKIDGPEHDQRCFEFYRYGLEPVLPLSAAHGYGLKSIMSEILKDLPAPTRERDEDAQVRIAVVGKPNAGKSSLINRILGTERLLVSEQPGTTRDAVDTFFTWKGKGYLLIDTAGIRKKARIKEKIEKFSVIKALDSLKRCHVAVILIDASEGVSEQDARICGYAFELGRGVILAVNKWDLVKRDEQRKRQLNDAIARQLQFVSFAPRVNVSALTGERVMKVLENIDLLYQQYTSRVPTPLVNKAIKQIIEKHPPPRAGRVRLKFYYATQTATRPPTFVLFVNRPDMVHFSYQRFLVNQFKTHFSLALSPVRVLLKPKH